MEEIKGKNSMKLRISFVSNSSSASFCVRLIDFEYGDKLREDFEDIKKEFSDWFCEIYNDCIIASNMSDEGNNMLARLADRYIFYGSPSLNYLDWRSIDSLRQTANYYNSKESTNSSLARSIS